MQLSQSVSPSWGVSSQGYSAAHVHSQKPVMELHGVGEVEACFAIGAYPPGVFGVEVVVGGGASVASVVGGWLLGAAPEDDLAPVPLGHPVTLSPRGVCDTLSLHGYV